MVAVPVFDHQENVVQNWKPGCFRHKSISLHLLLSVNRLKLLPSFLLTPDKELPTHRVNFLLTAAWKKGNLAQDPVCLVKESCTSAPAQFALYFLIRTSGSEINGLLQWIWTTLLGVYQQPTANLWQAKPAPSLDTPMVFEIKVDACNPGKWASTLA